MFNFFKKNIVLEINPSVTFTQKGNGVALLLDSGVEDLNRTLQVYNFSNDTNQETSLLIKGYDRILTTADITDLSKILNDYFGFDRANHAFSLSINSIRNELLAGKGLVFGTIAIKTAKEVIVLAEPTYIVNPNSLSGENRFEPIENIKGYIGDEWKSIINHAYGSDLITTIVSMDSSTTNSQMETIPSSILTKTPKDQAIDNDLQQSESVVLPTVVAPVSSDVSPEQSKPILATPTPLVASDAENKATTNPSAVQSQIKTDSKLSELLNNKVFLVVFAVIFSTLISIPLAYALLSKNTSDAKHNSDTTSGSSQKSIYQNNDSATLSPTENIANGTKYGFKDQNNDSFNNGVMSPEKMAGIQATTAQEMLKKMDIDIGDNSDLGCFTETPDPKSANATSASATH